MVIYHPPTATDYVNRVEIGLKMASSAVHGRGRGVYDQSLKVTWLILDGEFYTL